MGRPHAGRDGRAVCGTCGCHVRQGYTEAPTASMRGGEREALQRLARVRAAPLVENVKPGPTFLDVHDRILSPYLKFGCLSAALARSRAV